LYALCENGNSIGNGNKTISRINKTNNRKNRTLKQKKINPEIKPNKIKKALIQKIKEHQIKQRENEKTYDNNNQKEYNNQNNDNHLNAFEDEFKKSLTYLDALVKKRQQQKHNKSMKHKNILNKNIIHNPKENHQGIQIQNSIKQKYITIQQSGGGENREKHQENYKDIQYKPLETKIQPDKYIPITSVTHIFDDVTENIGTTPLQTFYKNDIKQQNMFKNPNQNIKNIDKNIDKIQVENVDVERKSNLNIQVPIQELNKQENNDKQSNIHHQTTIIKNDPPYGCLKGGKKPTYSQYNKTFKRPQIELIKIQDENNIDNALKNINSIVQERQEKLKKLKSSIQEKQNENFNIASNNNIHFSSNNQKPSLRERYKKYRIRTIKKTFKLGKYKDKKQIGVLIKNQNTRKKIQDDIQLIYKTPFIKIKRYLKDKKLIKTGSTAPEYVLRELYKNSILSGDIQNKNSSVLVHNYMNEE
jgi:hypothetical protein